MRKEALDNLTRGARPALHAAEPNWDTLKGLVGRAAEGLEDARQFRNTVQCRLRRAAFYLARVAACGTALPVPKVIAWRCFRILPTRSNGRGHAGRLRNRFDYGDVVEVSES
jgi:hypothetical protein